MEIHELAIKDIIESIDGEIEEKAESIAKIVKNIDVDIDILKKAEERLSQKMKFLEDFKNSLESYLKTQLELIGIESIKTPLFTVTLQNNPPSVKVDDMADLMVKHYVYFEPQPPKLDKKLLIQDIKNGKVIDGVELVQEKSIRIR